MELQVSVIISRAGKAWDAWVKSELVSRNRIEDVHSWSCGRPDVVDDCFADGFEQSGVEDNRNEDGMNEILAGYRSAFLLNSNGDSDTSYVIANVLLSFLAVYFEKRIDGEIRVIIILWLHTKKNNTFCRGVLEDKDRMELYDHDIGEEKYESENSFSYDQGKVYGCSLLRKFLFLFRAFIFDFSANFRLQATPSF